MLHTRHLLSLSVLGLVVATSACSSSPPAADPTPGLRGTYEATTVGSIHDITFRADTRYQLRQEGCATDRCVENGGYAIDADQKTLTLSPDTGPARVLSLEIAGTVAATKLLPSTVPLGVGAAGLVSEDGPPLTTNGATRALIAGQGVQLTSKSSSCLVKSHSTLAPGQSQLVSPQCGFYEPRVCPSGQQWTYSFNTLTDLWDGSADCGECGGLLTAATVVAMGGTIAGVGLGSVVAVPAGAAAAYFAVGSCAGCYNFLRDSGVFSKLDCSIVPCQYSTAGRQNECNVLCKTAYSYVPRVGTACQCTDNAAEACCRIKCYDPNTQPNDQCTCVPK